MFWKEIKLDGYGVKFERAVVYTSDFIGFSKKDIDSVAWQFENCGFEELILFDSYEGFVILQAGESIELSHAKGFWIKKHDQQQKNKMMKGKILTMTFDNRQRIYEVGYWANRTWYHIVDRYSFQ